MSEPKRGLPQRRRMRHDRHFVEELARRSGEGIGRMIPVDAIVSSDRQPRTNLGDLSDLVDSIGRLGVLEPLLVRRIEDAGGRYELVSGERRFHAALQAGLEEIPCIELDVDQQHALEVALIENLQRLDLSAFEEAEGFRTLIDRYGYTHQQVGDAVGRSRVTVTETLSLLRIPQPVRDLCRHADITAKGMLLQLARQQDVDTMKGLLQEIVEKRLNRGDLRQLTGGAESPNADTNGNDAEAVPASAGSTGKSRPFVVRFTDPDRPVRVSLSFGGDEERAGKAPAPEDVINLLEDLIARIRAGGLDSLKG